MIFENPQMVNAIFTAFLKAGGEKKADLLRFEGWFHSGHGHLGHGHLKVSFYPAFRHSIFRQGKHH
jgi:hypothetical protein